jgi:gas vesicle protein
MSDQCGGESCGCRYLAAFAVGALAGAGIALLYAPYSGRESRSILARRTRELHDKAGTVMDEAKEMIQEKKSELLAAIEAGKQAMHDEKVKLPAAFEAGKDALMSETVEHPQPE